MKNKQIITIILLVFVVGSVLAMVYKEFQSPPQETPANEEAVSGEQGKAHQIVAYYFYGNQRCPTCRNIEAYTQESLNTHFKEALETKKLVWKPVNIETAGNEHYVQDFKLKMKMVVLADMQNGEMKRWKKLEQIWPLSNDRDAFVDYVEQETQAYLKGV